MATANGSTLLSASISMPAVGAWHTEIVVDSASALSGAVTLDIDGVQFSGTVIRGGTNGGRSLAKLVGGNGGLSTELPVRNYVAPATLALVIGDILREAGETLSTTADAALLATVLTRWERSAGPASHSLVALLDAIGATWRVLADGTVWIGTQSWPTQEIEHALIDEDWSSGILLIAPLKPELRPAVTFRGQRLDEVAHNFMPEGLRTEARLVSLNSMLNRFLGHLRRQIDYSRSYAARVVNQNADGTLQVLPDDAKFKGAGLDRAPMRFGIPGVTVMILPGARCWVAFEGGDPALPYVHSFEQGSAALSLQLEATLQLKLKSAAVRVGANPDAAVPLLPGNTSQPSASFQLTTP